MHILACIDTTRLRQEASELQAMFSGLEAAGCTLTLIVPNELPDELQYIHDTGLGAQDVLTTPLPMSIWQRRRQGRHLAEQVHRTPPDVIWGFGDDTHPLAQSLAASLDCPVALSIWSVQAARRASSRHQHVGAWIAASPTLASIISRRVGTELVECILPAVAGSTVPAEPIGLAPSIAILDTGDDQDTVQALLAGLAPVVAAVPDVHICLELKDDSAHAAWRMADAEGLLDHISTVSDAALVRELITRCDVLIQPDRLADARSLVLEAMANARTIVCSPAPHLDWLIDGDTARYVSPHDEQAWSATMLELLHDPRQRQRLGVGARTRTAGHHGLEAVVEAYVETFDRTCNGASYPFAAQGTT
jgi:hypothetical protein